MQLTKEDLKSFFELMLEDENAMLVQQTHSGRKYIDYSKFLKVRKFYEEYKDDKEGLMEKETKLFLEFIHQHKEGEYKTQKELDNDYNDWLFSYCFKEGLK